MEEEGESLRSQKELWKKLLLWIDEHELFSLIKVAHVTIGINPAGKVPRSSSMARSTSDETKDEVVTIDGSILDRKNAKDAR